MRKPRLTNAILEAMSVALSSATAGGAEDIGLPEGDPRFDHIEDAYRWVIEMQAYRVAQQQGRAAKRQKAESAV